MIEDVVINEKIGNPNISNLSAGRWKNIVKMTNRCQVGDTLILLLQILCLLS